jgi:asparagine synthetase B (glutamine-hydrolysing)
VLERPEPMTPLEIAWGFLPGGAGELAPADGHRSARAALEAAVRDALLRPPCGVAFSGGRDSSLVLAVAVDVARREGLDEPVPVTKVFPAAPAAEEGAWQEAVIRHLGVRAWERVELHDELDVVGPLAQQHLVEFGVLWPALVHGDRPLLNGLRGGTLLDGEGGDEVLGDTFQRIGPLAALLRRPWPPRRQLAANALAELAPAAVRAARLRRAWDHERPMPWLR